MCDLDETSFCFFFKQKTAYEMRISDWSSDVCSSDLVEGELADLAAVVVIEVPLERRRRAAQQPHGQQRSTHQRQVDFFSAVHGEPILIERKQDRKSVV